MGLQSLLLCRDTETLRTLRRALDELGMGVEVLNAAEPAMARLGRGKFDAVIVDCDGVTGGGDVLAAVHESPSNKRAIAMALINGNTSMRAAFELGAHFALDKPLSLERAVRTLRAAQGFMVAEQRRYFRQPVDVPVTLSLGTTKLSCRMTNISDGGMAVQITQQVSPGEAVDMHFDLPGILETLEAKGEFAWADHKGGRAGIRFTQLAADSKKTLSKWLAESLATGGRVPLTSGGRLDQMRPPQSSAPQQRSTLS